MASSKRRRLFDAAQVQIEIVGLRSVARAGKPRFEKFKLGGDDRCAPDERRSAALTLSAPPRSTRCSAIRSLQRRIQGDLPSMPGSNLLPFVILRSASILDRADPAATGACELEQGIGHGVRPASEGRGKPRFRDPHGTPIQVVRSNDAVSPYSV